MVGRLEIGRKPCVVVDLDGTLIRGNSMREMIRHLLRRAMGCHNALMAMRLGWWLLLRRTGVISHKRMKYPIHRLASRALMGDEMMVDLIGRINSLIDNRVASIIEDLHNEGYKVLLATAAPDLYVREIAAMVAADGSTATVLTDRFADYEENRGEEKLRRARVYAEEHGCEIKCVITDHIDDLPLLQLPDVKRVLVNPSQGLRDALDRAGLRYTVVTND